MEFTSLGKLSIRIRLEQSDMDRYGVTYDDMDYGSARTKHIIWELLDKARQSAGFDTDGKKLHIQIFPSKQGGCELYISKISSAERHTEVSVYRFDSLEGLLPALVYLKSTDLIRTARLYERHGAWYVCTSAELCEYARKLTEPLFELVLAEHGRFIGRGSELVRLVDSLA